MSHAIGPGRPSVVDVLDTLLVVKLRSQGESWSQIADAHPCIKVSSGRIVKPSVGSIRRVFDRAQSHQTAGQHCGIATRVRKIGPKL